MAINSDPAVVSKAKKNAVENYSNENNSPLVPIVIVTLVLLVLSIISASLLSQSTLSFRSLCLIFSEEWVKIHSGRWLYERHIFIIYACAFAAWWIVYLNSRKVNSNKNESRFKKVRSLRRLLSYCSLSWSDKPLSEEEIKKGKKASDSIEAGYLNKASSSMTNIAILIAVSAIELQEITKQLEPLLLNLKSNALPNQWEIVVLLFALAFTMIAFISYIVSSDALDVMFNQFVDDTSKHKIIHYYYKNTINPRYAALISLITSFILLIAFYSPLGASIAIGLFFFIGYNHWFPNFDDKSSLRSKAKTLLGIAIIMAPFIPIFLGKSVM